MSAQQTRVSRGIPAGGQFAATTHAEPGGLALIGAHQGDLYRTAAATDVLGADRAAAARDAIRSHPDAFEDLTAEGSEEDVLESIGDDRTLLKAVENLGELDPSAQPDFGRLLAEQVWEDSRAAEASRWHGEYLVRPTTSDQSEAYELNDPKHPRFLERLGL